MAGRTIPVHDLRELLRHLQVTTNDSAVQRATGLNRRTIARYRAWAAQHALLTGPLPPLDELQQLVSTTLTIPPPPQTVSSCQATISYRTQRQLDLSVVGCSNLANVN